MKKIIQASAISILGLMLATGSVFATTTLSGNGAGSHNTVVAKSKTVNVTNQTNVTKLSNKVNTSTNTGKNKANNNTGGDVTVTGGSSETTLTVSNLAGSNVSTGDAACCCDTPVVSDISITGNGVWSSNKVIDLSKCITEVDQTNVTNIYNNVNTTTNTGGNHASGNTGGDVSVMSGDSTTNVTVTNVAGSNVSN
ncbi:hypothetical protein BH10PAT1_BH10PAT1_2110 [soil metagenome]